MRREITCVICYEQAKSGFFFSKPKGGTPDGNVFYFSSQECLKKFIFPLTLKEVEAKKRWRRLKIAFITLLAVTMVWTLAWYLLDRYLLAYQYEGYLAISGITIIVAWVVTTIFYLKTKEEVKAAEG